MDKETHNARNINLREGNTFEGIPQSPGESISVYGYESRLHGQDVRDHEAHALQYVHGRVHRDPRCVCARECAREHVHGCGCVNVRGCV